MKRSLFSGLLLLCAMAVAAPLAIAQTYVTAAINWPGNKVQFFLSDGTYVRYDTAADRADDGYPKPVDDTSWPGLGFSGRNIIGAFTGLNGKAYFFFTDGTYSRYDIAADHADAGYPKRVSDENWPGIGIVGPSISGTLNWTDNKVQFFVNDGQYLRYDLVADKMDGGYPQKITNKTWPGLEKYATLITAAVNFQNGKAYFFLGDGRYLRYDIAADHMDPGYPMQVTAENWPGLYAVFPHK